MIGADALLKSLENKGIKEMFAYPGGAVLPIYDRMPKFNIKRILVRHEQAAAFAAQGYSRVSDSIGVCLATSGPGATNLVTGIADAMMDSIPMIAITGNVFSHLIGTDAFQEIDIIGICDPIVKTSYFVRKAEDIPKIINEAFYIAKSGRPGPVLIDIPKDVQTQELKDDLVDKCCPLQDFKVDIPGYKPDFAPHDLQIQKASELIKKSKRPVVIYGHGVVLANAHQELAEFLDKTGIPSVWTLHGIGAYDPKKPLSLGMLGMHGTATANFAVHNADLIIGIGIRFDDRITGIPKIFQQNKKIIHFDIDRSEFDKNIKSNVKIIGSVEKTLPKVSEKSQKPQIKKWQDLLLKKQEKWPLDESNPDKFTEIAVIDDIYKNIDEDAIVAADVGQHQMWAAQRFPGKNPKKFITSGGLGTMGFAFPAAMGAARSGYETWVICGDGGMQMNIQELATIKQDNIPVKICILNNGFLGMVRQWQELFYKRNYVDTPLFNPDFAQVAKGYQITAFKAKNQEEAREVIRKMKNEKGPCLAEFYVEREENVFPMVPAGESLGDTLIDPVTKIDKL